MNIYDFLADTSLAILSQRSRRPISSFQEPDYTAALVTIFPQLLNMFGVHGCKYGGCFIHQKPKVHFNSSVKGGPASCEGGDLLVLLKQTIDGVERYNATLFQLKMHNTNSNVHHIHGQGELIQKELYTDWPQFSIIKQGKASSYDIQPKIITPGAQYMVVKRLQPLKSGFPHFVDTYFYNSIPSNNICLDRFCVLGSFMSRFISWQTGRPISAENVITEDWSKFIWELINTSKTSGFDRRNVHIQKQSRAHGDFFSFLTEGIVTDQIFTAYHFSPLLYRKDELIEQCAREVTIPPSVIDGNYNNEADDLQGISILFVEVPEK